MVAVRLEGRLGNQLFQYAFAYATARKLNTGFYLDKSIAEFIPAQYFELKPDFLRPLDATLFAVKGYKNVFNVKLKQAFYKKIQRLIIGDKIVTIDNIQPVSEALAKLQNKCMFIGYFQSEKYFENVKAELKQVLSIKKKHVDEFAALIKQLPLHQKKIVIHIRRGDYVDLNLALPLSYYKKALNAAGYQNALCIFISDDPRFIELEFSYIANKYVSTQSEIIDLQFLMAGDVCILSNSSFSWWGTWLNSNPAKIIYAPKNWLQVEKAKEYPTDIGANMNFHWITTDS